MEDSLSLEGYSTENLIRLEARIYALERYVKEHDPEGGWFLEQEFYKYLTVVSFRRGSLELDFKMRQERHDFEERCRRNDIEIKFP